MAKKKKIVKKIARKIPKKGAQEDSDQFELDMDAPDPMPTEDAEEEEIPE
jgi:hypothetical protein